MVLLGNTLEVPDGLGLGCMSVSGQYDNGVPLPEEQATAFFRGCYEAGCRHFDTAEAYRSKPELGVFNEGQLGAFFATVPRDSFTVGTKFHPGFHGGASDYATIRGALLASLQRLGLEYVDLYYAHRTPSTSFAVEFTTHAARLREEGLLRNIGLSECAPVDLRAACAVAPICAVQQEWSLLTRNAEEELIPVCKELGVGFVAYSPLARNLLAAASSARPVDKRRSTIPRFAQEHWEQNQRMGERLRALAEEKGVSAAQLSMGWLLQRARDLQIPTVAIPGTKSLGHALDNIASTRVQLTPAEMTLLEGVAQLASGERESDSYLAAAMEGTSQRGAAAAASSPTTTAAPPPPPPGTHKL